MLFQFNTIIIIKFGGEAEEDDDENDDDDGDAAAERTREKQREEDDCHLFFFFFFFFFFFSFRNGRQCDETVRLLSPFLADENNLVRKFRHILGGRESLSVRVGG